MPFDSKPTNSRLDRLRHLYSLLDNATDFEQWNYCSCLYHRVAMDPVFAAAGLDIQPITDPMKIVGLIDYHKTRYFFGLHDGHAWLQVFGSGTVRDKRDFVNQLIMEEANAVR